MKKEIQEAAIQETMNILIDFGIKTKEDLDFQDEEEGAVLYETMKAGVMEQFDIEDKDMEKIFDTVVEEYLG